MRTSHVVTIAMIVIFALCMASSVSGKTLTQHAAGSRMLLGTRTGGGKTINDRFLGYDPEDDSTDAGAYVRLVGARAIHLSVAGFFVLSACASGP